MKPEYREILADRAGWIILAIVVGLLAILWWPEPSNAAYSPLPNNYKSVQAPADDWDKEKQFGLDISSPGSTFRVFIPGGTTKVSLITYTERDVRLGVVARFGMAPQCSYTTKKNEEEYYALPWNDNQGTSINGINGKDYQARNWGGILRILDFSMAPISSSKAGWVYVKAVPYEDGSLQAMAFYVTVDVEAYKAWYEEEGAQWSGQSPVGNPGQSGGTCDPLWSKAGSGPEPDPTKPTEPPDVGGEFECLFLLGGRWIDGECIEPVEPDPEIPVITLKDFVVEMGTTSMRFHFLDADTVKITYPDTKDPQVLVTLFWEYEVTENEITVRAK